MATVKMLDILLGFHHSMNFAMMHSILKKKVNLLFDIFIKFITI